MSNIFNQETYSKVPRNWFDLSHNHKTTMGIGFLYPVYVEEVLPGDRFKMQTTKFVRCLPLQTPAMHRIKIKESWFYGPSRIIWDGFEEFITVRVEDVERVFPQIEAFRIDRIPINFTQLQSIGAYMGLPVNGMYGPNSRLVNVLPLALYGMIWNNYYRQTQIMQEINIDIVDGINISGTNLDIDYAHPPLLVSWDRGYFTSALPSPTIGIDVKIPLLDGTIQLKNAPTSGNLVILPATGAIDPTNGYIQNVSGQLVNNTPSAHNIVIDPNGAWELSQSGMGSIEMLRAAFALQAYLEKENRAGGRYKDVIDAHFATNLPDYRISIPEYIGSTTQDLIITEVLSQTQNSDADLGEMGGHAISVKQGGGMEYYCPEHGYLMCLISIVPDFVLLNKGLHRMWTREERTDFPFPSFANLGEQAILNQELVVDHNNPLGTFGYIPRYSEKKYCESRVSGDMAGNLANWHLGQALPNTVALNPNFLFVNQQVYDLNRIFQYTGEALEAVDNFILDIWFDIKVNRALPRYDLPMTLGHI